MRTITLEFLRHGPAHNQLLSRLTDYLALAGNHGAQTVHMPFDHNQLLHRLHALNYRSDDHSRQFQLEDTAQTLGGILGEVAGLTAELSRRQEADDDVLHLRLVISASELALVPFELANAPHGFPGAGQSLLLQNELPLCVTREVRRAAERRFEWPRTPKILFIVAQPPDVGVVPLEPHLLALRRVLEPWVNGFDDEEARRAQVSEFLTILPEATIDQIQAACASETFTHVHILAHGMRQPDADEVRFGLALHPRLPGDPRDVVSGARLATALRAVQDPVGRKLAHPAVVTLACCNSGDGGSVAGAGSSIAHALHGAGIPVVVASQFPLTFAGSIIMVEVLYEGLIRGLDPRAILNNLRRQLRAREGTTHDWASIVAYASLPEDFDRQLPDVQIQHARTAIERVLGEADLLVLKQSDWWKNNRSASPGAVATATGSEKSADQFLPLYRNKLGDAEKLLRSVLHVEPGRADEIFGLLAGTKKREAQMLHNLDHVSAGQKAEQYRRESIATLRQSLECYISSLKAQPNGSWPLHQVLSLSLALGHREYPHGQVWLQSHSLAHATQNHGSAEKSAWAHTDLLELYLLACETARWKGGPQVQTCLEQMYPDLVGQGAPIALICAKRHAREIVRLKGPDSFPVKTTARQIVRYRDWLVHFPESLLGNIGGASEALLEILEP